MALVHITAGLSVDDRDDCHQNKRERIFQHATTSIECWISSSTIEIDVSVQTESGVLHAGEHKSNKVEAQTPCSSRMYSCRVL